MIHLFDYWRSSASYRVRIALGLCGLSWTSTSVDLVQGDQTAPDHLARNPQGLVPVLQIDGLQLTQSLAIVEYLDETRALGLLPENAADRAHVRALAHAIAMDLHPVCNLRVARFGTAQNPNLSMADWMQHFIPPGLGAFEAMIAEGDFCFGARLSLADLCLVPQAYNARRWEVDMTPYPKIRRVLAHIEQIPAIRDAHPDLHMP